MHFLLVLYYVITLILAYISVLLCELSNILIEFQLLIEMLFLAVMV